MFKKKMFLPVVILALVISLTSCSNDMDSETDMPPNEEVNNDSEVLIDQDEDEVSQSIYGNIKVNPEDVFDIFMEKYPNAKVKQIQLDKDMGNYVYKVEGFEDNMEYELKINPIEGNIIKEDSETDSDIDDLPITRLHAEKVNAIVNKAMEEAGENAKLEEWTIEVDDGRVELEVEIDRKGFDDEERVYDVDTGTLIEIDD